MSLLVDLVKSMAGEPIGKVSDTVRKQRLQECSTCPHLSFTKQCKKCFCFVNDKTKYAGENCPVGNW